LRYRHEEGTRQADQLYGLYVAARGTAGASFKYGFGTGDAEQLFTVPCNGIDVVTVSDPVVIDVPQPPTEYLIVNAFTDPTPGAEFVLLYLHVKPLFGMELDPGPIDWSSWHRDRAECLRYAQPVGRGLHADSAASATIHMGVACHRELYTDPSLLAIPGLPQVDFARRSTGVIEASSTVPTLTKTLSSKKGARVSMSNFTGLASGITGLLATDLCAVLDGEIV
jgi:hypothetical protein